MTENREGSHTLSVGDFKRKPEKLTVYHPGDTVNRENFDSLLLTAFAKARGETELYYVYLRWLGDKTGFDWRTTFENFRSAGGWDCLTSEEQDKFVTAYGNVEGHRPTFGVRQFDIEADRKETLDSQLRPVLGMRGMEPSSYQESLNEGRYAKMVREHGMPQTERELTEVLKEMKVEILAEKGVKR